MSNFYVKMDDVRLDILNVMSDWDDYTEKLEAENKKLREALEFYANEGHIREYSYGQMVMLESEECEEGEDEKILPNRAGRVLASLNETR